MKESELEQLVEMVTRQVLAAVRHVDQVAAIDEGRERLLVIGDPSCIPAHIVKNAVVCSMKEYEEIHNILRYQRVIIETLTLAQLSDIASGRDSDVICCAVLQALLNGVDVWMLETALPHKKYAGKASTSLYQMLESYVKKIQVFGVKMISGEQFVQKEDIPPKPARFQTFPAPAPRKTGKPNIECLITETIALKMVEQKTDEIVLPANAILTPSAKDVFTRARITIRKDS